MPLRDLPPDRLSARLAAAALLDGFRPKEYLCGCDQVGTLKIVTGTFGKAVKVCDYSSFGVPLADSAPHFFIPVGFAGGLLDKDTGLIRFGWRDYDPEVGRFTTMDPAKDRRGDGDLYDYCVDDPVSYVDPKGLRFSRAAAVAGGESHKGISHPFGAPHGESMGNASESALRKITGGGTMIPVSANATIPATRNRTMPATQNATGKKTPTPQPSPRKNPKVHLGIELNNPTNLRPGNSKNPWEGQTGIHRTKGNGNFVEFENMDKGLRAGAINIISQQVLNNKNSVLEIISALSPSTDRNNTAEFAQEVAHALGVGVNDKIDTMNPKTLTTFLEAVIHKEVKAKFPPEQIKKAVDAAIAYRKSRQAT